VIGSEELGAGPPRRRDDEDTFRCSCGLKVVADSQPALVAQHLLGEVRADHLALGHREVSRRDWATLRDLRRRGLA
jgi:hypothetical protein